MAHEISENNGVAEAAYAYEPPWHGLGMTVKEAMTVDEALDNAHLRWEVAKRPIFFGDMTEVPDRVAVFRQDNDLYLGTVGKDWVPVQNEEQARFIEALTGEGATVVECVGALRMGARTFWTVRVPEDLVVGRQERISRYLIVCNGHDGTLSFKAFWIPIRVVCSNTLNASLSRSREGLSLCHRSKVKSHLDEARKLLGLADTYYVALGKRFEEMLSKSFSEAEFKVYVDEVFPMRDGRDEYTPMQEEARYLVAHNFRTGVGAQMAGKTAWGAYNAVTEYVNHQKSYRSSDRRFENLLLGGTKEIQQRAFKTAYAMGTG